MHPAQIQAALKMADTPATQADVARQCGVVPTVVHDVIHGNRRSKKVELRIAAITRLPLADLWPDWHGAEAIRRQRRQHATHTGLASQRSAAG